MLPKKSIVSVKLRTDNQGTDIQENQEEIKFNDNIFEETKGISRPIKNIYEKFKTDKPTCKCDICEVDCDFM